MNDDVPPPFMRLAKRASYMSSFRVKVGAVIADRRPIVFGCNKVKTHPLLDKPSIHAEMACILGTDIIKTNGASIYVYRETSKGPAMARPCDDCMAILKEYGIRDIYYSIADPPYWRCEIIR